MSDPDAPRYDGITLRDYVDQRFRDHEKATANDQQFYSKEMHDIYAKNMADDMRDLRREIAEKTKPTYWWASGLAVLVAMFGGIWYLSEVITRLDTAQKHIATELVDHNKQMEAFQQSLERLSDLAKPDHPPVRR